MSEISRPQRIVPAADPVRPVSKRRRRREREEETDDQDEKPFEDLEDVAEIGQDETDGESPVVPKRDDDDEHKIDVVA